MERRRSTFIFLLQISFIELLRVNKDFLNPKILQTKTTTFIQERAALDIIRKYMAPVDVKVNPMFFRNNKDSFILRTEKEKLHISASTGVAAVWGFHYFLKKYCNSHISWSHKRITIPSSLPFVNDTIVANDLFRYYQNTNTFAYNFVWWSSKQWLDHVEWMALNGINLSIPPIDQEAAWTVVYKYIGMSDEEINAHFTGPAFLPWLRMGYLHTWAGPPPKSWHKRQRKIQKLVCKRMLDLGMIPALPVFNGYVPKALLRIFPSAIYQPVEGWMNFSDNYSAGLFLKPEQPLFKVIFGLFSDEILSNFATTGVYYADPFYGVGSKSLTDRMVERTALTIFDSINMIDSNGVWLIQNWMFIKYSEIWTKDKVKSLVTTVPNGRILILDVHAEHLPQYDNFDMYYGQPFIWCMLHNFGGRSGMMGKLPTINKNVHKTRTRPGSTMIGIGLTPEGINQNYIVYDLMLEMAWRKNPVPDLRNWVTKYAERRYGCNESTPAWKFLIAGIYRYNRSRPYDYTNDFDVIKMPSLAYSVSAWYKKKSLLNAFNYFNKAAKYCHSPAFTYDLLDVARQALLYRAQQIYLYHLLDNKANYSSYSNSIQKYMELLFEIKYILASNDDFTAQDWLNSARAVAKDHFLEIDYYEMNARTLITAWGPSGENADYAGKHWAELFHYYYIPRWTIFLAEVLRSKKDKEEFNEAKAQSSINIIVQNSFLNTNIVKQPAGDTKWLALVLYKKWCLSKDPDLPLEFR